MRRVCWRDMVLGLGGIILAGWPLAAVAAPATRVAAGHYHTCAVTDAGAVLCWGQNDSGQLGDGTTVSRSTPAPVTGLASGVVAVTTGSYHTCALTGAGAVWCWGYNFYGQLGDGTTSHRVTPVAVIGLATGVTSITAGYDHSCAMTSGGAIWCWGRNSDGQLGDGTTTNRLTPVGASGLGSGVAAASAGYYHTCVVATGGAAWCWGYNYHGQLGDGTTTSRTVPVAVGGLDSGVVAVEAGGIHSCAVTTGGAAWCWGYNYHGQLGDGTTTSRTTPVAVSGLGSGIADITAGYAQTCAVTTGGAARCWGMNDHGQLGDGTTTWRYTPVAVSGLGSGAVVMTTGYSHTCTVTTAGALWCWGLDAFGQLGHGARVSSTTPLAVSGLSSGAAAVAAGGSHSCTLTSAGGASCWGDNDFGQLGDDTSTSRSTPAAVSGLAAGITTVSSGYYHTCAATNVGAAWCWGHNYYGQLGDGTTTHRSAPAAVSGLGTGVVAIAPGRYHTCAIGTGGAAWCWGYNSSGQLGDGTTTSRSAPVAVIGLGSGVVAVAGGDSHSCALTGAGAVWCWGDNFSGQLGDGTTTQRLTPVAVSGLGTGVVGIAAGAGHTCAVTSAGVVWCWGSNYNGQVGDGTTQTYRFTPVAVAGLAGAVSVTTGSSHSCAVTGGGTAWCWGYNASGQLGDGTYVSRSTPVSVSGLGSGTTSLDAGRYHTCAVTSGGGAWCWGLNDYGQLGDGGALRQLAPVPTVGLQPALGDVGRDGRSDLLWHHATLGEVWVWGMNGAVPLSQTHLGTVADTNWLVHGLGDQTGDGRADLLWRHGTSGALYLWTMSGASVTAMSYLGAVVPDYAVVGTADYTGDGRADILWRHQTSGAVWLWQMNGATLEAVTAVATIDPAFAVVASGDLNGDGKADLLWRHQTSGDVWVWLMDGATPTNQVHLGAVSDLGFHVAGLADHDRDGKADVLWHHAGTGDVWLWRMNGATIAGMTHVATVGDTNFGVVGVGDYDGDAKADVLWRHATTGELWEWKMDGGSISSSTWVATIADVGYQVVKPR